MGLPYSRRSRRSLSLWQLILMVAGVVLIVVSAQQLLSQVGSVIPTTSPTLSPGVTPTLPTSLARTDVLPTPTVDHSVPPRYLVFPAASLTSRIIEAIRTDTTWETRYLGDSVGHLEGTSWFDNEQGNIVLAGHVESATGAPGPFAFLFKVNKDDLVILQEGAVSKYYRVTEIIQAKPDDVYLTEQNGSGRLTMITCTEYDYKERTYNGRLVVIAEPLTTN
ncbi:MAG TPA: sortase [Aggregatilineales bacterium]|nr:sortase [Anaerolineales bacterium]HRE47828.1 sortase [Aggregatilineales bacterium]